MGTRGIFGFKCDGEYKLKWNQFDSYPDLLGDKMTDFVNRMNEVNGWDTLKKNCEKIELVDTDEHPTTANLRTYDQYREVGEKYFHEKISRRNQSSYRNWQILLHALARGNLLEETYAGKVKHLLDERWDMISDWEYAYVLNLDANELEFYQGYENDKKFDSDVLSGRWDPDAFVGSCPMEMEKPLDFKFEEPPKGCLGWKGKFFPECDVDEECGSDFHCVDHRCIRNE